MSTQRVIDELQRMAERPGIEACALVDAFTGLVWHASEGPRTERVWEAAVEYWRLHCRQQSNFSALGALGAAVMYHTGGVLAVLPCCADPEVLLVALGAHRGVDWIAWQQQARTLGGLLRDAHRGAC